MGVLIETSVLTGHEGGTLDLDRMAAERIGERGDLPRAHAELGAELAGRGAPMGTHDLWIAATAVARGLDLVTLNAREYQRVPGRVVEVWGQDPSCPGAAPPPGPGDLSRSQGPP